MVAILFAMVYISGCSSSVYTNEEAVIDVAPVPLNTPNDAQEIDEAIYPNYEKNDDDYVSLNMEEIESLDTDDETVIYVDSDVLIQEGKAIGYHEGSYYEYGGDFDPGRFRGLFYSLPAPFVDLIGRDAYFAWLDTRSQYEMDNINIAVSFIHDFNISREDFERANEELRIGWSRLEGATPNQNSSYEIYPVDIIFSFDNELINEYFLWENSPGMLDFGLGASAYDRRVLFYRIPPPFMELVGREAFIEWQRNRCPIERENESIAESFVRDFNISMRDFARVNNEVQAFWDNRGWTAYDSSIWEVYNVELIFSMDSAAISEYFEWENSPSAYEREWAASR